MYTKFGLNLEDYPLEYIKQIKEFFATYNSDDLDCILQIIEYANKTISVNENSAELVITTTAMRIGKVKLLAIGLQNEADKAIEETKAGTKNSIKANKRKQ